MNGARAEVRCGVAVSLALACAFAGAAQIVTCTDPATGKKLTSDRPIPECNSVPQRVLNSDGSVREIKPPTPTAEEIEKEAAREFDEKRKRVVLQDAVRRDRNLLVRFPNEAAHARRREAELDEPRKSLKRSEVRIAALAKERKPLEDEAEFYKGRQMPAQLKRQLDANDASVQAQRDLIQNAEGEILRINTLYDTERERLKLLWAGALPGSLGPMPAVPAAASAPPKVGAR